MLSPLWAISDADSRGEGGVKQVSLQLCLTLAAQWEVLSCFVFTDAPDM